MLHLAVIVQQPFEVAGFVGPNVIEDQYHVINPEEVTKHLHEAILKSALGKHIHEAIENVLKQIKESSFRNDDMITAAVKSELRTVIVETVKTGFLDRIREQVKERITDEFIDKTFDKMWAVWMERGM